ncbi:MAG: DUF4091 domain-containing protein [Myxococcales bacterium]|nr:DUF4091 domain-containing protein [Myxococcales bacterium]
MNARIAVGVFVLWLASPVGAQNLVPNGDFEGGLAGWTGGVIDADRPHGGASCLRVDDLDSAGSIDAHTSALIPIEQGRAYRLRVWIRAALEGQALLVTLNQHDAGGAWISGNNMDFLTNAGTGWTLFERVIRSFHPQAGAVRLYLRPVPWSEAGEATGTAWFDDVVFETVPDQAEPRGEWLRRAGPVRAWSAPVEHKVRRETELLPEAADGAALRLELAAGETEAVQLVLWPERDNALSALSISPLSCSGGGAVAPEHWSAREVAYLEVTQPSDHASYLGWLPDPLPTLTPPLNLPAGRAAPLWLSLALPPSAPAGTCAGTLSLEFADDTRFSIPVEVRVFGFDVPREHHLQTAYGLWLYDLDRYHHLNGDPALRRQVFRLYLEALAAHRISVYDPMGDDGIGISFAAINWPLSGVVADPEDPGNRVLRVEDDRTDANVSADGEAFIPVGPGTGYQLSWRARTDTSRNYLVAATQHRADRSWISGRNLDFVRGGDGTWLPANALIDGGSLDPQAAFLRIHLYACPWTSAGELVGTAWFDDVRLVASGSDQNLVPNGDFEIRAEDSPVEADFSAADPALEYALDTLGMDAFRLYLPYFAGGDWTGHTLPTLLGLAWGTPEYEALYTRVIQAMTSHLASRGWLEKAYAYWYDEPQPADYELVRQGMDLIRRAEPRLRRLLTEQFEPELAGAVDIWSPLLDYFSTNWSRARQSLGEEVWWYVCTWPPAPYPGNFIDHEGLEHRIRYWMAWQYGVQGDLYWAVNYWTCDGAFPPGTLQDPWADPMAYNFYQGQVGTWGNGDGRLLYPPRDFADGRTRLEGPVPSLRLELIRDGIEDFEYFWLLRDVAGRVEARGLAPERVAEARALLDLPATLVASTSQFGSDPGELHAYRRAVAEMIEELLGLLSGVEPDGGVDGVDGADGADSGRPDEMADSAADADGGRDGGGDDGGEMGGGCGCGIAGPEGLALMPLLFALRQKRRRPRRRAACVTSGTSACGPGTPGTRGSCASSSCGR